MAAVTKVRPPPPPDDPEMRTIIDKLANFVARNGPEFEQMTKSKQQQNAKFSFLFGGQYHQYYLWKVGIERAMANTQAMPPTQPHTSDIKSLLTTLQSTKLKEQDDLGSLIDPLEAEFINVVKPVMISCTKESIASGKGWIFSHSKTEEDYGKMAHFIMRRTLDAPDVDFNNKLHIIYLINDLVHHCIRKGTHDLQQALETVILQIFYNVLTTDPSKGDHLVKVLNIWESQQYFSDSKMKQIKRLVEISPQELPETVPPPPSGEQGINKDFTTSPPPWSTTSFSSTGPTGPTPPPAPPWQQAPPTSGPPWGDMSHPRPGFPPSGPPPPWIGSNVPPWTTTPSIPPVIPVPTSQPTPLFPPKEPQLTTPPSDPPPPTQTNELFKESIDYNHQKLEHRVPPSGAPPPPGPHPPFHEGLQVFDYNHRPPPAMWDMPRPPFPPPHPHLRGPPPFPFPPDPRLRFLPGPFPRDLPPPMPYYDLPAGLMVPLVPLHENNYHPINPFNVCLPPPQPPSERLLQAVEEFYQPSSDDKPRNEEGWEAKALLDFYDAKMKARESFQSRGCGPPIKRTRRKSRSYSPRKRNRSSSRSSSYSPQSKRRSSRSPSSESRSTSRSRSPSPNKSRSPYCRRRSRSLSPDTPTLEEFSRRKVKPTAVQFTPPVNKKIEQDNVGHQMLKRMGWEGTGLGAQGQGIQNPIKGGEVRDKANQFAGVGINLDDPFERFRRSKSYTFNRKPPPGST